MIVLARQHHNWGTLVLSVLLMGAVAPAIGADHIPVAPGASWRTAVREFARVHYKNPAWGFSHSVLAHKLAAEDRVVLDDDVMFAAAYLHDVGAFAPWTKDGIDHQDIGADLVASLLNGTGFPMAKIQQVRDAIRTHMYDRKPVGPESIYLHDADALDWLGAIGVARVFALVDPNGGDPDGPQALKMLQDYLTTVPPGIVSQSARLEGVRRERELRDFLRQLSVESDAFRVL